MEQHKPTDEAPNPLVRQRDLDVVVANNRTEHWKTRLAFAIVVAPSALKSLPSLLAYLHIANGWIPWA